MKCKCGKECGIRVWCEECEEKAIMHLKLITAKIKYKKESFEKKTNKIFKNMEKEIKKVR